MLYNLANASLLIKISNKIYLNLAVKYIFIEKEKNILLTKRNHSFVIN